ncbi:TauD/TfdA family dioxygenase [Streptomyces sp. NPDC017529]|uniref:TauD/TfdA family dioxygenase n=1 Tax=Streptomyces sp. NPDC017529 TaxID=3365000 RepID=UPI0037891C19
MTPFTALSEPVVEPRRPPLVRVAGADGEAPLDWLERHGDALRGQAAEHGSVLVRGLRLHGQADAVAALRRLMPAPYVEYEPFAPRTVHAEGVYSSSEWPPDQPMCMHHEVSYALDVPSLLAFCCVTPPASGGVTALADSRRVLADLPAPLVERFERLGWELLRNYHAFVGVPWQSAFPGGGDRAAVEDYCRRQGITFGWDDDGLRTRQLRPAVARHPLTGERCWFNQIAFLNEETMDPAVREYLALEFGEDGLPFTTRYGDGTPIDRATVDLINEVYERHTVRFTWERGDLLLVDNVLTAHSREPYRGDREIVVAMGGPVRL